MRNAALKTQIRRKIRQLAAAQNVGKFSLSKLPGGKMIFSWGGEVAASTKSNEQADAGQT